MTLKATLEAALIGKATKADVIAACDKELNDSPPTPPGVRRGERYKMRYKITASNLKTPIILHAESEDDAWKKADAGHRRLTGIRLTNGEVTAIMEEKEKDAALSALRAERDELLKLVSCLSEKAPCARCVNGKDENGDACEFCGGYGFHPAGDIREYMLDARAVLAKYAGKEE